VPPGFALQHLSVRPNASIDSSILGAERRFVVDGPVNDPRVQPWTNLFAQVNGQPMERTVDVDTPAALLTTSGTTGQPKFVTHTLVTLFKTAESLVHLDLDGDQNVALAAPMVHASGLFTMLAVFGLGLRSYYLNGLIPRPSWMESRSIVVPIFADCRLCL
jgi:long-chain acyl-CoA synthetase